tara:strand:+ start:97 stop:204 length:108 start_codon:yes stop_codon:yes gene_type:complete
MTEPEVASPQSVPGGGDTGDDYTSERQHTSIKLKV